MATIRSEDIIHAVACGDKMDRALLFLTGNTVVRISMFDGSIQNAFTLPEESKILQAVKEWRAGLGG